MAVGIDMTAALSRLPDDSDQADEDRIDTHAVRELLLMGERFALTAISKFREDNKGGDDDGQSRE